MSKQVNGVKVCSKCRVAKPVAEFSKRAALADILQSQCRACRNAFSRSSYRKLHPGQPGRLEVLAKARARNGTKQCRVCERFQPVSEFYKQSSCVDGLSFCCRSCLSKKGARTHLRQKYGITMADWQRMFDEQGGVCKICGKPEQSRVNGKTKRLSVDHHHKTGVVRGLLCSHCNIALGFFCEDVSRLQGAIEYLGASLLPEPAVDTDGDVDAEAGDAEATDAESDE